MFMHPAKGLHWFQNLKGLDLYPFAHVVQQLCNIPPSNNLYHETKRKVCFVVSDNGFSLMFCNCLMKIKYNIGRMDHLVCRKMYYSIF